MSRHRSSIRLLIALACLSFACAASASAQVQSEPEPVRPDPASEIDLLKAENAAVRELLRRMEEEQKALQERIDGLAPASAPQASAAQPDERNRYRDGIVIWENPADTGLPFLLKFNNNTQ